MLYKVKELADMAGVSVRTLHHYDRIGLLHPNHVTEAGYRQYTRDDLKRLQHICFLKELELPLKEIASILDRPIEALDDLLDQHKTILELKVERLLHMIETIEKTQLGNTQLESIRGETMKDQEMFEAFDKSAINEHKEQYAKEAKERWGHTDAYKESARRTAKYTDEDHQRINAQRETAYKAMVALMNEGVPVSDTAVQTLTAQLRQNITDHYYECTLEIFKGLGEMYVLDERFTKNLNKYGDGFAKYLSDAIAYYCSDIQ